MHLPTHDEFHGEGGSYRVEGLQIQTFDRHNRCKSLPLTLQFSGSPGFLPLRIGLPLQTHILEGCHFLSAAHLPSLFRAVVWAEGICLPPLPSFHIVISCSDTDYKCHPFALLSLSASFETPSPPLPSLSLSLQLLHTSRVINSRDVLVLKACKTEHPLSAERTPCLSSTEMGHLVRNPIKHIPHKVGLFGYFSLSLASLKSYYLFKVPHITPSRRCQCLTVSSLIALINYPRAPKHTA